MSSTAAADAGGAPVIAFSGRTEVIVVGLRF